MFAHKFMSANKKNAFKKRSFRVESLESRQMMAGDVMASLVGTDLYISEAAQQVGGDNGIRISRMPTGKIQVLGTLANGSSSTMSKVNGQAAQEFTVNGSLFVNLGAGNDRVQIAYDGTNGVPTFGRMVIDVGAPSPVISKAPINSTPTNTSTAKSVGDSDQVLIWGANTRDSVTINTGDSNDWVYIGQVNVGDGIGNDKLSINTGAAGDQVTIKGATIRGDVDIQTYKSLAETDQDGVFINAAFDISLPDLYKATVISGSTNVRMGGGDDSFLVSDPGYVDANVFYNVLETHGFVSVDTGAGNDSLLVRNANIGDASSDDVNLDNFVVNTGAGADSVRFHNVNIGANLQLQMYSSGLEADIDIAAIDHLYSLGDISVLTGGGDDQVTLDNVTAHRELNVDTSNGNDHLDLLDYVYGLGDVNLFGGLGTDRLTYRSNNFLHNVTKTGWEFVNGIAQLGQKSTVITTVRK